MTDENKAFSAENENPESEVCIYRHEILKTLFAAPSGKTSSVFSVLSFIGGFSPFVYELLFLSVGFLGTMGFAILIYLFAASYIMGSLALNLLAGVLLLIFCLVSNSALRKLRRKDMPFQAKNIKKASLMPKIRGWGLLVYAVAFLLFSVMGIYDLMVTYAEISSTPKSFDMLMEYLSENQAVISQAFWVTAAAGIFLLLAFAWFGIGKYYSRVYKYAEKDQYKNTQRPPYFRMVLAIIICFLTLNIPTALYMIFTLRWFKGMHAGIVSARLLK